MYHDALFYTYPFFVSIVCSVLFCYVVYIFCKKYVQSGLRKQKHHIHKEKISRFGGIAMIGAFVLSISINHALVFDELIWAVIIGSMAIMIFGIVDDIRPISWKSQIFFQVALVLMTFIYGVHIEYITNPFGGVFWLIIGHVPLLSIVFMLLWMMLIMNAVNWSDGIDGLSGGVVFIAAISIFIIALEPHVMQPPIAIMSITFAGSVFGFVLFNFPPARLFAGSSGAFFMGYVIAVMAIAAGAKIGTTLLVLIVPLVDVVWVIAQRVRSGRSIFHGDKRHLHHRLLDCGWRVKEILFVYYGITLLSAGVAVLTQSISKFLALIVLSFCVLIFFIFLSYDKKSIAVH